MIPFASLNSPRGADWGYRFRSGKRGRFQYWYEDTRLKKYYPGHKPSEYLVKSRERRINGPKKEIRCDNPWKNYYQTNPEIIETAYEPVALMNYFGITDVEELDSHENLAYLTVINSVLHSFTLDDPITVPLILKLHRNVFGNIYPWGGKYRTVPLAKGYFKWPPPAVIEREMLQYGNDILKTCSPARYNDERIFIDAAKVAGDLLVIHPFREGNGRVAELLAGILILQAGFKIPDMTKTNQDESISAALDAYSKNYKPLSDLLMKTSI